jgi:hypothetical protein
MYGGKNVLLYPKFIECIKYTEDIFWKSIFEDLSYGKCPYGVYICNNHICCNYKDKKFSYKIDIGKESLIIYNDIINILKNKFGLLSKNDKILTNKLLINTEKKLSDSFNNDWSYIKKKNIKTILIEKFVITQSIEYNLSRQQSKQLYNEILLGLLFKTINKGDIVYENKNIISILCISFSKGSYKFKTPIYNFKSNILFI